MSRMKPITRLFPLVAVAALGLSFAQGAHACLGTSCTGGGGSIQFVFGKTVVCSTSLFTGSTGTTFGGTWDADPGNADPNNYALATVTQDIPAATCYDQDNMIQNPVRKRQVRTEDR